MNTGAPISIVQKGLTCWTDGFRVHSDHLIYLSLFGPRNAVRGVWAAVMEQKRSWITVGDFNLSRQEKTRYVTLQSQIGHQLTHLVMLHPGVTQQVSPFAEEFYVLSESPAIDFFDRLNRLCRVPFRTTWAPLLWQLGLEAQLITPLSGHGLTVHHIETGVDAWCALVVEAVKQGKLK